MKYLICYFGLILIISMPLCAQVHSNHQVPLSINEDGNAPHTSAVLDLQSDNRGFLLTRLTTEAILAINNPTEGLQIYSLDEHCKYIFTNVGWQKDCPSAIISQDNHPRTGRWSEAGVIPDLPGSGRGGAISFVIDDMAYVGLGQGIVEHMNQNGGANEYILTPLDDFYKYDPVDSTWTPIASFPDSGRLGAVAFVLDGEGYVGTGISEQQFGKPNYAGGVYQNDFYKYNPDANTWTPIPTMPGLPRAYGTAFVIDGEAYVGTGRTDSIGILNSTSDFYKYNPLSNSWSSAGAIADYPYGPVEYVFSFVLEGEAYLGNGQQKYMNNISLPLSYNPSAYRYNPSLNQWSQIIDSPVGFSEDPVSFVIHGEGYISNGKTEFYKFNRADSMWTRFDDRPNSRGDQASSFVVNDEIYLGLGIGGPQGYRADFNTYIFDSFTLGAEPSGDISFVQLLDNDVNNELQTLSEVLIMDNSAENKKIINLAPPTSDQDAATKKYVDDHESIQNLTQVLGTGNSAGGTKITNLGAPTDATDATNKEYVDNAVAVESPTGLSFAKGWENYGQGFQSVRYYKNDKRVYLEGLARKTANGGVIVGSESVGTLTLGYRPPSRLIFTVNQHESSPRVDILPDGQILIMFGFNSLRDYVSLSGISFRID